MHRPCPKCGEPAVVSTDNPNRPFCSERCKLLDLGEWLDGGYVIPGEHVDLPTSDPDEPVS